MKLVPYDLVHDLSNAISVTVWRYIISEYAAFWEFKGEVHDFYKLHGL